MPKRGSRRDETFTIACETKPLGPFSFGSVENRFPALERQTWRINRYVPDPYAHQRSRSLAAVRAGFCNPSANPSSVETIDAYLERLASRDAVPGGGSAAALTGAIAAALIAMVGRIREVPDQELVTRADRLRADLREAGRRDERAYAAVVEAQALPKTDQSQRAARRSALEAALQTAAETPLHAAGLAVEVLELAQRLTHTPLKALSSDVGSATKIASAAVAACAYNVRVNHRYMRDSAAVERQAAKLAEYERVASQLVARVRSAIDSGTSPQP